MSKLESPSPDTTPVSEDALDDAAILAELVEKISAELCIERRVIYMRKPSDGWDDADWNAMQNASRAIAVRYQRMIDLVTALSRETTDTDFRSAAVEMRDALARCGIEWDADEKTWLVTGTEKGEYPVDSCYDAIQRMMSASEFDGRRDAMASIAAPSVEEPHTQRLDAASLLSEGDTNG